jgi:hypothetical protein
MTHTVSHTNSKIGQANRQIYKVPACTVLVCGPIRLVGPLAVIITHKKQMYRKTLEKFIHKDRPRIVGCVHYRCKPTKNVIKAPCCGSSAIVVVVRP